MNNKDLDQEIRLKELELEQSRMELRGRLVKVWVFCIAVLAIAAIKILMKDRDNPNSLGYLLMLIDFNLAMWPPLIVKGRKDRKDRKER